MISALLLAAGESRRMGDFKQLLHYRGKTFVECCVDNLLASTADEVVVVTGYRESEVRQALEGRSVKFVHNPAYPEGMSSSIKRGISGVSDGASGCLIALADQPQIPASVFAQVIARFHEQAPLIAVAAFGGRKGHPILVDMKLREEVLNMDTKVGLKQVVKAHIDQLILVDVSTDSVLSDCDFPEDYNRLRSGN